MMQRSFGGGRTFCSSHQPRDSLSVCCVCASISGAETSILLDLWTLVAGLLSHQSHHHIVCEAKIKYSHFLTLSSVTSLRGLPIQ